MNREQEETLQRMEARNAAQEAWLRDREPLFTAEIRRQWKRCALEAELKQMDIEHEAQPGWPEKAAEQQAAKDAYLDCLHIIVDEGWTHERIMGEFNGRVSMCNQALRRGYDLYLLTCRQIYDGMGAALLKMALDASRQQG